MTTKPAQPAGDPKIEAWLEGRGVKFTPVQTVPLIQINHAESRKNQARFEPINREVADTYAQALRNGETLPPVVGYKRGEAYVLIDGNHRDEGHIKADRPTIDLYCVNPDTPSETIFLLTAEANAKHGHATDAQWRTRQAVQLLALGHDPQTVASALSMSSDMVLKSRRIAKAEQRADKLRIDGFEDLPNNAKIRLGTLASDAVFQAVSELVMQTSWDGGSTFVKFMAELKELQTENEQMVAIGDMREQREIVGKRPGGPKRYIHNPKNRVVTAFGSVMALDPTQFLNMFVTDEERKEIAQRASACAIRLMEIEEVLAGGQPT